MIYVNIVHIRYSYPKFWRFIIQGDYIKLDTIYGIVYIVVSNNDKPQLYSYIYSL